MDRRIGLKVGQKIRYMNKPYEVVKVYPYIAYIHELDDDGNQIVGFNTEFCVGIGDLVIGGVEPIGRGYNPVTRSLGRVTIKDKFERKEDFEYLMK